MDTQWFERGYEIENNKLGFLLAKDTNWQLYSMSNMKKILIITGETYDKIKEGVYKYSFKLLEQNKYYFITQENYVASSLSFGPYPQKYIDVINFSKAFANYRNDSTTIYDLLYIEELELITEVPKTDDNYKPCNKEELYTSWITNGVKINPSNIERLKQLTPLNEEELRMTLKVANINIDTDDKEKKSKQSISKNDFSLIGRPELEKFFKENIIDILENEEKYSRVGINFPNAIILYGKPGCGKTYAVEKLTDYLQLPTIYINSSSIGSSLIHETSKKIVDAFEEAIKKAPSVMVIDEMEAFLSKRNAGEINQHRFEEMSEFLKMIPQAIKSKVLIIAMTNMIDEIDPAILRTGRFDLKFEVKMASKEEIECVIRNQLEDLPISNDIDYSNNAAQLEGKPLSDVTFVIREACKNTVRLNKDEIDQECFDIALKTLTENAVLKEKRKIGF